MLIKAKTKGIAMFKTQKEAIKHKFRYDYYIYRLEAEK